VLFPVSLASHCPKLEVFDVLDELVGPLHHHMTSLVSQPIDGTDARLEHVQTMKAYLDLLVNIMTGRLYVVFVSPRMSYSLSVNNAFLISNRK
jgi:exportin-T